MRPKEPNGYCPGCNVFVKQNEQGVVCYACAAYWHYSCANVTEVEIANLGDNEFFCREHHVKLGTGGVLKSINNNENYSQVPNEMGINTCAQTVPYVLNNEALKKKLLKKLNDTFDHQRDVKKKDKGKQFTVSVNTTTVPM